MTDSTNTHSPQVQEHIIDKMAEAAFDDGNHARKSYAELTEDWKTLWRAKMRAALRVFLNQPPAVHWEVFCDAAYFDMWAVRPEGEQRWGFCYHLPSKEEAESLAALLNNEE